MGPTNPPIQAAMSLSKRAGAVRNAITDLFRVSSSSRTNDDYNRQRVRPNGASSTHLPPSSPLTVRTDHVL